MELELRHAPPGTPRAVQVERHLTRLKQEIQQLTEMQYCYMAVLNVWWGVSPCAPHVYWLLHPTISPIKHTG